ncbi:F-box only protein 15 [Brachyistius frenatus]|uniref:F-box only protein 15 n=1 Tax=Brachyistius frenatus TaxID=100188 RepID=UPI0037E8F697
MATSKAVVSRLELVRTTRRTGKKSSESTPNFLGRLPSEILIKILSYLDASALFSISHINKLFDKLANDNILWQKIYTAEFGKHKKRRPECIDKLLLKMEDGAEISWKWLYFNTRAACDMYKWNKHLEQISSHTGLPRQTERVLRNLNLTWELTVTDKSGQENTLELSCSHFFNASVTLSWSAGVYMPDYQQISTLQIHGVRRIALKCPGIKIPGWRSLMATLDMQALTKSAQVIGEDRLVQLKLLQCGVIIGVWRDQCSVAFVMVTLHFHRLVERSTQGSSVCPYVEPTVKPPPDDIDPEYGLHGYQLHITLHNTVCELMSERLSQLYCCRDNISDGLVRLTTLSGNKLGHIRLSGHVTLPWRCEALQGTVENCCIMSLTLLDEFGKPFKCLSSPVSMAPETTPVCYDYDGENYVIHYKEPDIQVKMRLVWMKEHFAPISLAVHVSVSSVNEHFTRYY